MVFLRAIARHHRRVSHVYFDISGVAGLGEWESKKELTVARIRQAGLTKSYSEVMARGLVSRPEKP